MKNILSLSCIVFSLLVQNQANAMDSFHVTPGEIISNRHAQARCLQSGKKTAADNLSDVLMGSPIVVKMPDQTTLKNIFEDHNLQDFIDKTTIIKDLADCNLRVSEISLICQHAFDTYAKYLFTRNTEHLILITLILNYNGVNRVLAQIFSEYPGVLEQLSIFRSTGIVFPAKI